MSSYLNCEYCNKTYTADESNANNKSRFCSKKHEQDMEEKEGKKFDRIAKRAKKVDRKIKKKKDKKDKSIWDFFGN